MSLNSAIERLDARRWSLTARMTVFFGSAIAVIVVGVSAMMYAELVHQVHEKEEVELLEDLHVQQEVLNKLRSSGPPTRWEREWRAQQDEISEFAWQQLGPDGRPVAASRNADSFAPGFAMPGPARRFYRVRSADTGRTLLVYGAPDSGAGGGALLRGILDVSQDEQVLRRYLAKLLSVVVLAVALSVLIGWLLARRGLAPVRAISAQIGRMNADHLHARIAQHGWPAELRTLAETFDELMARIEQAFEQLSRFSSDLAHEFRSPINNLVAAVSVTLGRARSAEEYQTTLAVVVEEGARLSRMVSSMLFLARADHAKQPLQRETLSTRAEFRTLIDFFEILAEEQGVRLEAEGDVRLQADPLLLRQALSNLLANALRYSKRGGLVRLAAQEQGEAVLIAVSDNGAGIAPAHLPFLFDRYYRADAARSAADSTGLGLAVVRSIVELHGGSIDVHSTLGAGATFTIRLPKEAGK
jgi:two-component system heavy metal sensor histidine kinase CusS